MSYLDSCFLDSFYLWSFYLPAFFPLSVIFLFILFLSCSAAIFFFIWKVEHGILIKQPIYFCLFILLVKKKFGRLWNGQKRCLKVLFNSACWVICDFLCQTLTAPRCRIDRKVNNSYPWKYMNFFKWNTIIIALWTLSSLNLEKNHFRISDYLSNNLYSHLPLHTASPWQAKVKSRSEKNGWVCLKYSNQTTVLFHICCSNESGSLLFPNCLI